MVNLAARRVHSSNPADDVEVAMETKSLIAVKLMGLQSKWYEVQGTYLG